MYCKYCGKQIIDNCNFCSYCGKQQNNDTTNKSNHKLSSINEISIPVKSPSPKAISSPLFSKITSIVLWIGIVGFMTCIFSILFNIHTPICILLCVSGVLVITVISIALFKIKKKNHTVKIQTAVLLFGVILLLPWFILSIIYESKVDIVTQDIPSSGTVTLQVDIEEEFYSYTKYGTLLDPYSYLSIDGEKYDDSSEFEIVINKDYDISVVVGYSGESGVANSRAKESTTAHICFTPDNLCNGYNSSYKIPIGSGYANVKIEFKRICSFWEVILY